MLRAAAMLACACFLVMSFSGSMQIDKKGGSYDPAKAQNENLATWSKFNQQFRNRWRADWNPTTGTPSHVSGYEIALSKAPTKGNIESVTRQLLKKYRNLLQADPQSLTLSKADFEAPAPNGSGTGTWRVYYKQTYRGLPVYGGSVRLIIRNRKLTTLGSDYYPGIDVPAEPRIAKESAVEAAKRDMAAEGPLEPQSVELLVYPKPDSGITNYHLAWRIVMPGTYASRAEMRPTDAIPRQTEKELETVPVQWCYFVDANAGDVLDRINLAEYYVEGTVTGAIHRERPSDAPEIVRIPNNLVWLRIGTSDHYAVTDVNGKYDFEIVFGNSAVLNAYLSSPSLVIHNDELPEPGAAHMENIMDETTHDWNWSPDDPSPNDVATSAFYHANWIQQWFLRGAPFDITPLPAPMDVHVRAYAGCGSYSSNAGLFFGTGTSGGCGDAALCADVIYHEYTHRVIQRVYDYSGVNLPYDGLGGAMREGWADYFGATAIGDPRHGTECLAEGSRNIDIPDMRYPGDWTAENGTKNGMILSGALWDTRAALGASYVDGLAMRAMKDATTTFGGYLGALLEEDDDPAYSAGNGNPADGTPNIDAICHCFYDEHGIFHNYCDNHTDKPVAIITAPSPLTIYYHHHSGSVQITGTATGSKAGSFKSFTLECGAGDNPSAWSLINSGTAAVKDGILGEFYPSHLPEDGLYTIRLVVLDNAGQTASTTIKMVSDIHALFGWPALTSVHFTASPAAAELISGQGVWIADVGDDGFLYVLDKAGTLVTGWRQSVGGKGSSPVIADIDHDAHNTKEIICASSAGVYAFDPHGALLAGWPRHIPESSPEISTPAVGDLDANGDLEIVFGGSDGTVYALHHDGTDAAHWPQITPAPVTCSAAIGDLDCSGGLEVVVAAGTKLYAWHADGNAVDGFPIAADAVIASSPVIGDLNADWCSEVVAATSSGKVYAWDHEGHLLPGWPKDTGAGVFYPSSPALGDLNEDCLLEVAFMDNNNNLHVWQANGEELAGWPKNCGPAYASGAPSASSPVIACIIAGYPQAAVAAYGVNAGLLIFDRFGILQSETHTAGCFTSTPAIADINLDSKPEIILGSDGIWVWSTPGFFRESAWGRWPMYRCNAARAACQPVARFSLEPQEGYVGYDKGSGTFDVISDVDCSIMTLESSAPSWLSARWQSYATQNPYRAPVEYHVLPNYSGSLREATVSAAGKTFTVRQECRPFQVEIFCVSGADDNTRTGSALTPSPCSARVERPLTIAVKLLNGNCRSSVTVAKLILSGVFQSPAGTLIVRLFPRSPSQVSLDDNYTKSYRINVTVPEADCAGVPAASLPGNIELVNSIPQQYRGKQIILHVQAVAPSGDDLGRGTCTINIEE